MIYIANDGSWGDAEELVVISLDEWDETEIGELDWAHDHEKVATVLRLASENKTGYHQVVNGQMKWFPLAQ